MRSASAIRDDLCDTLTHIQSTYAHVRSTTGNGPGRFLTFPDAYRITEGLLLSAWSNWETFCRELVICDLANDLRGALRKDVQTFKSDTARHRLAERVLSHPDAPEKFVEWSDYRSVKSRAGEFLGPGHRFEGNLPMENDIVMIRRTRNAIAHQSDKAWISFMAMIKVPPFALQPNQRRAITPGRFMYAHTWGGADNVFLRSVSTLSNAAHALVP